MSKIPIYAGTTLNPVINEKGLCWSCDKKPVLLFIKNDDWESWWKCPNCDETYVGDVVKIVQITGVEL